MPELQRPTLDELTEDGAGLESASTTGYAFKKRAKFLLYHIAGPTQWTVETVNGKRYLLPKLKQKAGKPGCGGVESGPGGHGVSFDTVVTQIRKRGGTSLEKVNYMQILPGRNKKGIHRIHIALWESLRTARNGTVSIQHDHAKYNEFRVALMEAGLVPPPTADDRHDMERIYRNRVDRYMNCDTPRVQAAHTFAQENLEAIEEAEAPAKIEPPATGKGK